MIKVNLLTKAQITAFILIGMVLFILFLLLYFISSQDVSTKLSSQVEKTASDILYSKTVNLYTTTCLEKTLKQGLTLLGQQGGLINQTILQMEGNSIKDYEDKPIKLWIKADGRTNLAYYPCEFYLYPPFYCKFENNPDYLDQKSSFKFGELSQVPLSFIEQDLEKYIEQKAPGCANFTSLLTTPDLAGTEIIEQPPTAKVKIGTDDVRVELKYPITVEVPAKEPILFLLDFNAKAEVRLDKILNAVKKQTEADSAYINYNISHNIEHQFLAPATATTTAKTYDPFKTLLPGAELVLFKRQDADIIIIADKLSQIGPEPYKFRYARYNRPPALDYLSNSVTNPTRFSHKYDIWETIQLKPNATDPDEDTLTYEFTGWGASGDTFTHQPTTDEVGINQLNLTVEDEHGYFDYQEINILICSGGLGAEDKCDLDCGALQECVDLGPNQANNQEGWGCDSTCNRIPCAPYLFNGEVCEPEGSATGCAQVPATFYNTSESSCEYI